MERGADASLACRPCVWKQGWLRGGEKRHGCGGALSCFRPLFLRLRHTVANANKDSPGQNFQDPLPAALVTAQTPHFPLGDDGKQQYALGLFHLQLPTSQMNVVTNSDVNSRDYMIGKDSQKRIAIGHTGELGGFLSAYWTFPEEDSPVVVLCNSFQINGDPTNIVAQFLVQVLFDLRPAVDFVKVAHDIVRKAKGRWATVLEQWNAHRREGTEPKKLGAYTGIYRAEGLAIDLEVFTNGGAPADSSAMHHHPLQVRVNGSDEQVFELRHYHDDSWTFLSDSRDECIKQGYSACLYCWESFVIHFSGFKDGRASKAEWRLDPDLRVKPQSFSRKP